MVILSPQAMRFGLGASNLDLPEQENSKIMLLGPENVIACSNVQIPHHHPKSSKSGPKVVPGGSQPTNLNQGEQKNVQQLGLGWFLGGLKAMTNHVFLKLDVFMNKTCSLNKTCFF